MINESEIKAVIETDINPVLALHNGSCELVSYSDGVVSIRLIGGCISCPSSHLTLLRGVIPILERTFPEIIDVVLEA